MDLPAFLLVAGILLAAAHGACLLPARSAASTEPMQLMRPE
jgi:ABC-type lipoprotein release transport system permease subunit